MRYTFKSGDEFLTVLKSGTISNDSVDFSGCQDADVIAAVVDALQLCICPPGLQINLYGNKIGSAGAKVIADALQSSLSQELQINLSSNNIGDEGAKDMANALRSGKRRQITYMNLKHNNIGAEGANDIANALQSGECPPEFQISLEHNFIGDALATAIAKALQSGKCPRGLGINLSSTDIGAAGAKDIANALQLEECAPGLQINLGYNFIGDVGATAIANALQSGKCAPGLQINLEYNGIGSAGFQALANAILSGKCPQGLRLEGVDKIAPYLIKELEALLWLPPVKSSEDIVTANSDENEWPNRLNAIRGTFCVKPEIILENKILRGMTQGALARYIRVLQLKTDKAVSETDYCDSYYPAFLDVANVILAILDMSQSASVEQKQWVSILLLTLAECVVPLSTEEWASATYLWTLAQRLVLLEQALLLDPADATFLARYWQDFCDEINDVKKADRTIALDDNDDVEKIKANSANKRAINYFKQVKRKGLTTQPGMMVSSMTQTDFFATQNKTQKFSHEVPQANNNLGSQEIIMGVLRNGST